jgi:hypothetical protein
MSGKVPPIFGASISIKQCRNFDITPSQVIHAALQDLHLRRFRLMSYWNEHEQKSGQFNFEALDQQVSQIASSGGTISMCLGARQPRWPESHWPSWSLDLPNDKRTEALMRYITEVINRYKDEPAIVSWQLENEALLKNFGEQGDFDRKRIRQEYELVKSIDSSRPVIMTTSTSWGVPIRRPIPDIVGFSLYRVTHDKGKYRTSIYQPWIFKLRQRLIKLLWNRTSFIHELQAEPWGPQNIWEMDIAEQNKSMSLEILQKNLAVADAIALYPIDFWGLEWWYWSKQNGNPRIWNTIKSYLSHHSDNTHNSLPANNKTAK